MEELSHRTQILTGYRILFLISFIEKIMKFGLQDFCYGRFYYFFTFVFYWFLLQSCAYAYVGGFMHKFKELEQQLHEFFLENFFDNINEI